MSGQLADLGLYPFDYGRFFNQCEQALPEKRMKYKRPSRFIVAVFLISRL
jgi:hypothetical protein